MTHPPVLRRTTEGRTIAVVGDVYRFLAPGEDANGRYALWESAVPPGGGATLCPDVKIGSKSVIGAGSVVTRDIPDGVLAAGNPCRVIREITA